MCGNLRSSRENACPWSLSEKSSSSIFLTVKGLITSFFCGSTTNLFPTLSLQFRGWQLCGRCIALTDETFDALIGPIIPQPSRVHMAYRSSLFPRTTSRNFNTFKQFHSLGLLLPHQFKMGGIFLLNLSNWGHFSAVFDRCYLIPCWYGLSWVDLRKIDRFCLIKTLCQ